MSHHPSCRLTDKDLVWHCTNCGENESAGSLLVETLARQRKGLESAKLDMETMTRCYCAVSENCRTCADPCYRCKALRSLIVALAQDAHSK